MSSARAFIRRAVRAGQWWSAVPALVVPLGIAQVVGLAGCSTVGPSQRQPEVSLPAAWHAPGLEPSTQAGDLSRWWTGFADPVLPVLIERALTASFNVRQAEARIREARARRGVAEADRFPTLAARAGASRNRRSEEVGFRNATELYSSAFDASWELDLFGARRLASEAAQASLEAAGEDLRDVRVTLSAEVALNYVETRAFQARLALAQGSVSAQLEIFDIARWRNEAGLVTQLDVEQARTILAQTQAQIPTLVSGLQQSSNRLAVLLGQPVGSLEPLLTATLPVPSASSALAVGMPADLLRRRPDIRRAERQLAAQAAQTGAAAAGLYPKLSLSGSIGLESLASSRLLFSTASAYSAAANAAFTVFDAGRLRQSLTIQGALHEQALLRYESAVQSALLEVENALTAYSEETRHRRLLSDAVDAASLALQLATSQYTAGMIDFQPVLETQRSLLTLQDQLAGSDGALASDLIRLYKALGGGWDPASALPGPQP